jgi:hypothetical protein
MEFVPAAKNVAAWELPEKGLGNPQLKRSAVNGLVAA